MRLKKLTIILGILTLGIMPIQGQDTLLIEASASKTAVSLRWYPADAYQWLDGLNAGYQIERFEVGQAGANKIVLAERLLPKDSTWFNIHKEDFDGLMEPIGALLYDTTFQFEPSNDLNSTEMRYNYVVKEAEDFPGIASAVGLAFRDSTVVEGKKYRYVIRLMGDQEQELEGQLEIGIGSDFYVKSPPGKTLKFTFPNNISLSKMNQTGQVVLPAVKGIIKAYGDSIVLRWGPNSAKFWGESNQLGYSIERRAGRFGEIEELAIVKPWPQDSLEGNVETDSMALLAAAQLYSKEGEDLASGFVESAEFFENRWAFALFSAERSPLAADVLGLRFVDKDVKPDSLYFYTVRSLAQPSFFASARMQVKNERGLDPSPIGFKAESRDKAIRIVWEKESNRKNFSSYEVDRSEDGNSWETLRKEPIVFMEDPDNPLFEYAMIDSVEANYKTYYYRLRGSTSFGEFSEYSEIQGQAIDLTPPPRPIIQGAIFNDTLQSAIIRWDAGEIPDDFDGFYVLFGHQSEDAPFDTISQKLTVLDTEFVYQPEGGFNGEQAHYFKISACDVNGNSSTSLDKYMHVPDIVPPPPPESFTGIIEDDGTVKLYWEHSQADDVLGYWLYFSNNGEDEYSLMNEKPLTSNTYSYKVQDVTLNKYLFFVLAAEDERNNRGKTTPVLKLKRPDKVPPMAPSFSNPRGHNGAIHVKWGRSPSDDVAKYYVFRRQYESGEEWQEVHITNHRDSVLYIDTAIVLDVLYEYKIRAEDDSENVSEDSPVYSGKLRFEVEKIGVDKISALPSPENKSSVVSWDLDINPQGIPDGLTWEILILKSTGSGYVDLYQKVPGDSSEFIDPEPLKPNIIYNYAVQVLFSNGQEGKRSPVKSVMLE